MKVRDDRGTDPLFKKGDLVKFTTEIKSNDYSDGCMIVIDDYIARMQSTGGYHRKYELLAGDEKIFVHEDWIEINDVQ